MGDALAGHRRLRRRDRRGSLRALKSWTDDDGSATLHPTGVWKLKRAKSLAGQTALVLPASVSASLLDGGWTERDEQPVITNPLGVIPLVEHPNRPCWVGSNLGH